MQLDFNRQRVQNEHKLSGLGALPVVWWSGRGFHHTMAQDQFQVRKGDRSYTGKNTAQQARVLIYHHRGLSLSLPGNCPRTHKAVALRQEGS